MNNNLSLFKMTVSKVFNKVVPIAHKKNMKYKLDKKRIPIKNFSFEIMHML